MSLHTELKGLFDDSTRKMALRVTPSEIDALEVHGAAMALLCLKGLPDQQVALVRKMPPATAAALCRWLSDPAFLRVDCNEASYFDRGKRGRGLLNILKNKYLLLTCISPISAFFDASTFAAIALTVGGLVMVEVGRHLVATGKKMLESQGDF